MITFVWRRLQKLHPLVCTRIVQQRRSFMYRSRSLLRYKRPVSDPSMHRDDVKSEWWCTDGEMHEIGENVPVRERFPIFKGITSSERRKRRYKFMHETRLTLNQTNLETEQESWCEKYSELYNRLREQWEKLYWDDGYSNKLAETHANYDSADDDDQDFSPYRQGQLNNEQVMDCKRRYDSGRQTRKKASAPFAPFIEEAAPKAPQDF